jgi:hypothetical protein
MANTITTNSGTQSFIFVNGTMQKLSNFPVAFERLGIDGHEIRINGERSEPSNFVAVVDVASKSAGETAQEAMRAARGSLQTIVNSSNETFSNVLIEDVVVEPMRKIITSGGGVLGSGAAYLLTFRITARDVV